MTDKEKLDKLVAEIERLYNQSLADENRQADRGLERAANVSYGKSKVCKELLSFIDSMQKEPKECMYSKDNYTDEDRKTLCKGCEEECKYNKKKVSVSKDWSAEFDKILEPYKNSHNYKKLCLILRWWKSNYERWWHWKLNRKEEPVSEDLEEAARKYAGIPEDSPHDLKYCVQDKKAKYDAVLYGANLQKEQMLAKAVDAVVKIDAGGYPYIDSTIELYDYDKDIPLAKRGDKVKILVIRES